MLVNLVGEAEPTGAIGHDVRLFLRRRGCPRTGEHSRRVAVESRRIATLVGADADRAEAAGWLHDVSAVVPDAERAEVAKRLGLEVLPEEAAYPLLVHQKLSAAMTRELFEVTDEAVLSAIGCHTMLKPGAAVLDKILFVADKVEWDGAACSYLHALWEGRESLKVVHPWLVSALPGLCDCGAFPDGVASD